MASLTCCRRCAERICGAPASPIDEEPVLAADGFFYHGSCEPGFRRDTSEAERCEIALRLASPKRPGHIDAADVNHLPLFIAANEPPLL